MAKPRKPIPKTQREISLSKQRTFKGIEGRGERDRERPDRKEREREERREGQRERKRWMLS